MTGGPILSPEHRSPTIMNHCTRRQRPTLSTRREPRRRGTVTVELALTIGLLFFFFFAALEFCRVNMLRHSIENAVYEGARVGAVPGGTSSEVKDEVMRVLRTIGVRNADIDVRPSNLRLDTPEIRVSVDVPIAGNLYFPPLFFKDRQLQRSISMLREVPSNASRSDSPPQPTATPDAGKPKQGGGRNGKRP